MDSLKIEVSIGEIVDKLSILEIKSKQISDPDKLKNVKEYYNDYEFDLYLKSQDFYRKYKKEIDSNRIDDIPN